MINKNWVIKEKLGNGVGGTVFVVKDIELKKDFALKIFTSRIPAKERINEIELTKKLNHPNCITCLDCDSSSCP